MPNVNKELESTPLPEMVKNLGLAVAEAQGAMDRNTIARLIELANPENGVQLPDEQEKRSLLELGFVPSFYHFTRATIEARVAFSSVESREIGASASLSVGAFVGYGVVAASVSASYSNKYSFEASGSSVLSTEIVSVPPPAAFAEIISRMTSKKTR